MKSNLFAIILMVLFASIGCGENREENAKQFNKIEVELIHNYEDQKTLFDELKHYFKLSHIKYIEFSKNGIVTLQYKIGSVKDTGNWKKLENKEINSPDIKQILDLDGLSAGDLHQLSKNFSKINVYRFWLIDYYDATRGKYTKEIDLKYTKQLNGLHFYYRLFQEPLDSMENSSYSLLINKNETGGVLSDSVVWYYR